MKGTKTPFKNEFLFKKELNNLYQKIMFLENVLCSIKYNTLLHSSAELSSAKGDPSDLPSGSSTSE